LVWAEGVFRRHSLYRRIELIEKFVGNSCGNLSSVAPRKHVFVSHDHPIGLGDRSGNRLPVIGRQRPQIDDLHRYAFSIQLCGGHIRTVHQRTIGDDAYIAAFTRNLSLAEWDGEVRSGIWEAIVRLAVKVLVFEEEDGIIAADCGAQKAA